jgi:small conductance mechanosensitive channel
MPEHLTDTITQDVHNLLPLIVTNGLSVLGAIAILVVGLWLSGKAHVLVVKALRKTPHLDQMLTEFFGGVVRYLILTVTVLAVLSQFGVQTTSLVAIIGAAGLAVGLALQGTLSNLAAGVMLLIFRPLRIGQAVQIGSIQGTVKEVSLFWTELVTSDNVQIIVPNNSVWGQPLRNFSFYPVRGIEVHFRVPETTHLERMLAAVRSIVESDGRIVSNPAPGVSLDHTAADNYLEIVVNVWSASGNVGAVKTDLVKSVHEALDTETVR